jgi:hypothetical protein
MDLFGTARDPLIGKHAGGVIIFGGGLPLYDDSGLVGGLGVSGDTSCADHNVAWRLRHDLGLDHVRSGPSPDVKDGISTTSGQQVKASRDSAIQNVLDRRPTSPSILVPEFGSWP